MSRQRSNPSAVQIRWINAAVVYDALRDRDSSTASDLMETTGLSRPTIHTTCDWLIAQGLVTELPNDPPGGAQPGRPARLYRLEPRAGFVVALDIRESSVGAVVADLAGNVCGELNRAVYPDPTLRSQVMVYAYKIAEAVLEKAGVPTTSVRQVCVSIPAPVQSRDYMLARMPQYIASTREVVAGLDRTLPWPVVAENDANLAMIGEQWQGVAGGVENAILLDVCENGFGAGLIVNGQLARGSRGLSGEMTAVDLLSGMGPDGGVNSKAVALGADAVRSADPVRAPGRLYDLAGGDPRAVSAAMVFAAAEAGDPTALHVVELLGAIVARPIAMLATILDPELVVVCGLDKHAASTLMPALEHHTRALFERELAGPAPRLALSTLDGRGTLFGAIRRALTEVEERLFGSAHTAHWPVSGVTMTRGTDRRPPDAMSGVRQGGVPVVR